MLHKIIIAITVLISAGVLSNEASARWRGGGHHWHGGHGGHWHGGWGWGWPAFGFGLGYGAGYYGTGYYGYPYHGSCYRSVRVGTRYGWRWRRVWVCG